jgi:hypothetical protein
MGLFLFQLGLANHDDDDDRKKKKRNRYSHTFGLDFGFNNYLQDDQFPGANNELYSVKPWGSWYVAVTSNHINRIAGPLHLQFGADVSWYNFKFEDPFIRAVTGDNGVSFIGGLPTVIDPIKSKLTATYLNLSLVPTFIFGKQYYNNGGFNIFDLGHGNGFRIGAGGYVGYNLADYAKFVFEDEDNERQKERNTGNFFVNNWRYGVKIIIGVNDVDFFLNYDLNPLFAENRGPELNAVSFGVRLL